MQSKDNITTGKAVLYLKAESHQRQLVEGSGPTYKTGSPCCFVIPPTGVGGYFKSNLVSPEPQN